MPLALTLDKILRPPAYRSPARWRLWATALTRPIPQRRAVSTPTPNTLQPSNASNASMMSRRAMTVVALDTTRPHRASPTFTTRMHTALIHTQSPFNPPAPA